MSRAAAAIRVPGRASEAEELWYDPARWGSWIDGWWALVTLEGPWPEAGARRVWDARPGPGSRGRVVERVVKHEARAGQALEVEDAHLTGLQRVTFAPGPDDVQVTLTLDYSLKERMPLTPLVDVLVTRRRLGDGLRRTLERFAAERGADVSPELQ